MLSRTQAGPGRTGKQEQEEISRNHIQTFFGSSVQGDPLGCRTGNGEKVSSSQAEPGGNQLSCCLVSLLFLCHILSGRPVHVNAALMQPCCPPKEIPCIRTVNIGRKVIAYMISTSLRQNCFLLSANIMRTRQHFLVRNSGLVFDIQCIT